MLCKNKAASAHQQYIEIFSQQKVEKNVLNLRISGVDKGVLAPDRQYILSKGQKTWVKG